MQEGVGVPRQAFRTKWSGHGTPSVTTKSIWIPAPNLLKGFKRHPLTIFPISNKFGPLGFPTFSDLLLIVLSDVIKMACGKSVHKISIRKWRDYPYICSLPFTFRQFCKYTTDKSHPTFIGFLTHPVTEDWGGCFCTLQRSHHVPTSIPLMTSEVSLNGWECCWCLWLRVLLLLNEFLSHLLIWMHL